MTFDQLNEYSDALIARKFEGLPLFYDFDKYEMHDIMEMNKLAHDVKYDDKSRKVYMSQVFSKAEQIIE